MTDSLLSSCITAEQRDFFEEHGYLVLPQVLEPAFLDGMTRNFDALCERLWAAQVFARDARLHFNDVFDRAIIRRAGAVGASAELEQLQLDVLRLITHDQVFPKVWGILGWHIALLESQITALPPGAQRRAHDQPFHWHQDGGHINAGYPENLAGAYEPTATPRLSLKVSYYLGDASLPNCGNMWLLPGSHRTRELALQYQETLPPELVAQAVPLRVPAGSAVLHDRRAWHAFSANTSELTRKIVFINYGYRWLDSIDTMDVSEVLSWPDLDPVHRQLLRDRGRMDILYPDPKTAPLWLELERRIGKDKIAELCPRRPSGMIGNTGTPLPPLPPHLAKHGV